MKKILSILFVFCAFASQAQLQEFKGFGESHENMRIPGALLLPTGCGEPAPLNPKLLKYKQGAIYTDSCGNQIYFWNPATNSWNNVSGALPQDGRISGAEVTWTGDSTAFFVQAGTFRKFGEFYTTNDTTIILDRPNDLYGRIDLIVFDTSNGGQIRKVTGELSPTPIEPSLADYQIKLTTGIAFNAGSTTPSNVSVSLIYDENVEWTAGHTGTMTVNFNNTSTVYHGSKSALVSGYSKNSALTFGGTSTDVTTDGVLSLWINLTGAFNKSFTFQLWNNTMTASNSITVSNTYGFNPNYIGWQNIAIPLSAFSWTSQTFNKATITITGNGSFSGLPSFYLDYLQVQKGLTNSTPPTDYSGKLDAIKVTKTTDANDTIHKVFEVAKGIETEVGEIRTPQPITLDAVGEARIDSVGPRHYQLSVNSNPNYSFNYFTPLYNLPPPAAMDNPEIINLGGEHLQAYFRLAPNGGHVDNSGKISRIESFDNGVTWSDTTTVYDDPVYDDRNLEVAVLDNNRIILFWRKYNAPSTYVSIQYMYSDNGGTTWSTPVVITPTEINNATDPFGHPFKIGSAWYKNVNSKTAFSELFKSTDNGVTWTNNKVVWDSGDGYEASYIAIGDTVIALARTGLGSLRMFISTDGASTFTDEGYTNITVDNFVVAPRMYYDTARRLIIAMAGKRTYLSNGNVQYGYNDGEVVYTATAKAIVQGAGWNFIKYMQRPIPQLTVTYSYAMICQLGADKWIGTFTERGLSPTTSAGDINTLFLWHLTFQNNDSSIIAGTAQTNPVTRKIDSKETKPLLSYDPITRAIFQAVDATIILQPTSNANDKNILDIRDSLFKQQFAVLRDGKVMIGNDTSYKAHNWQLNVIGSSTAYPNGIINVERQQSGTQNPAQITVRSIRGSYIAPTPILNGTSFGRFSSWGSDGTLTNGRATQQEGGRIDFLAAGDWSSTNRGSFMSVEYIPRGQLGRRYGLKIGDTSLFTTPMFVFNWDGLPLNTVDTFQVKGSSYFDGKMKVSTLKSPSGLKMVTTDVNGLLGFTDIPSGGTGGSSSWGSITGTLSSQTDLQTALDAKAGLSSTNTFSGSNTFSSGIDASIFSFGKSTSSPLYASSTSNGAIFYNSSAITNSSWGIYGGTISTRKNIGLLIREATGSVVVQGAAGQTANLQEWQNDSKTVLAAIDKDGKISAPNIITVTTGTAAPTTTPSKIGDEFLDTTNKKYYKAFGTSSSADWIIMN